MSTDNVILENALCRLILDERSGHFDLDLLGAKKPTYWTLASRLSADEVVDLAMKLIQPTLYNVADPKAFMESIRAKLAALHV